MFSTVLTSWTFLWSPTLCYFGHISSHETLLLSTQMQRKFAVTSVIKVYPKMWELCMHPDYDHFIPLTSK